MESKDTQDDTETQFSGVILCFFVILLVQEVWSGDSLAYCDCRSCIMVFNVFANLSELMDDDLNK